MQYNPNAFKQGWDMMQGMRDTRVNALAGRAYASGDLAGAQNIFAKGGNIDAARQVKSWQREDKQDNREAVKERLTTLTQTAKWLKRVPADQRDAALEQILPTLGLEPEMMDTIRRAPKDDQSLGFFVSDAEKKLFEIDGSILSVDPTTSEVDVIHKGTPKPFAMDPEQNYYLPNPEGGAPADAPAAPTGASSTPKVDDVWEAAKMQESSGKPGVLGPPTQYGQAQGLTQMLPETAKEMADKLGVPWRPELMTGTTPEAAQYQERLGRAYFDEGLQKYGGDPVKALMYYHGGPNEALWGPKTRAHAQAVMRRVTPYQVAASGDTPGPPSGHASSAAPQIPGYRLIQPAQQQGPEWRDLPGGGQVNIKTGKKEGVPGADKEPAEGAKQTVNFAYRSLRANDRMNALADKGIFKPRTPTAQLFDTDKNGVVRVITKTAEDRQFIQAAKEWLAPILRKDTGAAVTDTELITYMDIFIPRFEDDVDTIRQKAAARFDTMTGILAQAGPLYDRTHGARPYSVKMPHAKQQPGAGPKPGTVEDGYRFKGGDPGNPESWVKVR